MTRKSLIPLLGFLLAVFFLSATVVRNMPQGAIKTLFNPVDQYVLSKLGFFHRGWGMFPTVTKGAALRRVRYVFADNSEMIDDFFPLRSSIAPSVWNEVMEDMMARHDSGDQSNFVVNGFIKDACLHLAKPHQASGQMKTVYFESAFVSLYELFTNYGAPYNQPRYTPYATYSCEGQP
jgi:hypothetical protein